MALYDRRLKDGERRRQQIIAASKRVFASRRTSKATIKEIAEEAEPSPVTLYIYLKNKDELCPALPIRMLKDSSLLLQRVKELSNEERIIAIKEALLEAYDVDSPLFIMLSHLQDSETLDNISPALLDQILGLSRKSISTLADIFAKKIEDGNLEEQDPQRVALIM